ncbi:hypothetical protein KY329_01795 [Candidatus Woesearchaeota archaeon]|nr:hypothetical protein [Candidatus Woesearchaeota archaeon]
MDEIYSVSWMGDKPVEVSVLGKDNYLTQFDIDYCKVRGQFYYHWSGAGPSEGVAREGLDKLPNGVRTFEQLVKHLALIEDDGQFCDECDDWFPDSNMCDHLFSKEFSDA